MGMMRLMSLVKKNLTKKKDICKIETVAVFFDLEEAYDTTWRYGILKDLHNFGLKGRLPNFIKSFLEDRTIQVRVGSTLSRAGRSSRSHTLNHFIQRKIKRYYKLSGL